MAFDRLTTARIRNFGLTIVMVLASVLLLYKAGLSARQPDAPAFDFITVASLVLLIGLTILVFSIGRFVASIDDDKFAIYTQVGWKKFGMKTYNKTSREFVMIEQDEDHYYCLTIKTREGDSIVIEKYPTLDYATGPLQALKQVVT